MKMRAVYIAIPVLPTLFGYGLNALLAAAITGGLSGLVGPFYVLLHIGFLILWFFSGWAYGKTALPKGAAILLGNLVGLVSLLLYLWQFLLVEDGMRNLFLSAFSQMFCTAGTRLGALVSLPLKSEFNTAPQISVTCTVVFSTLIMSVIFAAGVLVRRHRDTHSR